MSRSASFPPVPEPKRPVIRARRNTLPPMAPPPRKEELAPALPAVARRATLPPMPVLPFLSASDSGERETAPDSLLDETQVRPADDDLDLDASVPGVTEVRSALRFNRRRRIPASELFEASTNKIDRHKLLREAGLLSIKDENTAPTLTAVPPLSSMNTSGGPPQHARSTMQVSPGELERVRRLSETLEKDSVPVLELVDSLDLSMSDLVDDDEAETLGSNDLEAETLAGPIDLPRDAQPSRAYSPRQSQPSHQERAEMLSDPNLQAFRGNEDWGLSAASSEVHIESGGRPLVNANVNASAIGESSWLNASVVRFAEESDVGVVPADVSFEDDRSPVPDLRPESLEVAAVVFPHEAPATLASPPVYSAHRTVPQIARASSAPPQHTAPQVQHVSSAPPAHYTAPLPHPTANMSSGFAPVNPGTWLTRQ